MYARLTVNKFAGSLYIHRVSKKSMPLHLRQLLHKELSDCNNFWCTYYSDNRSSKDSFIFPTGPCLCNYRTLENTKHENSHISEYAARYFARNKNWITIFTPTFVQLFNCSKCHNCARTQAFSLFLNSLIVESMTFCCRPFQTWIVFLNVITGRNITAVMT